ncbi:hypothetical protein BC831DRAFT_555277 [Entophlyctis helioformis]|nr:hypothetical protein BC831DRAFT_555277 [Entophlyctis helioformis]
MASPPADNAADGDDCAICLQELSLDSEQQGRISCVARHVFHLQCIQKWAQVTRTCPMDRSAFGSIDVLDESGRVLSTMAVKPKEDEGIEWDVTECVVCHQSNNEDSMLLCDGCDGGWHLACIGLQRIPEDDWFCPDCTRRRAAVAQLARAHGQAQARPVPAARSNHPGLNAQRPATPIATLANTRRPTAVGPAANQGAAQNAQQRARPSRTSILSAIRREVRHERGFNRHYFRLPSSSGSNGRTRDDARPDWLDEDESGFRIIPRSPAAESASSSRTYAAPAAPASSSKGKAKARASDEVPRGLEDTARLLMAWNSSNSRQYEETREMRLREMNRQPDKRRAERDDPYSDVWRAFGQAKRLRPSKDEPGPSTPGRQSLSKPPSSGPLLNSGSSSGSNQSGHANKGPTVGPPAASLRPASHQPRSASAVTSRPLAASSLMDGSKATRDNRQTQSAAVHQRPETPTASSAALSSSSSLRGSKGQPSDPPQPNIKKTAFAHVKTVLDAYWKGARPAGRLLDRDEYKAIAKDATSQMTVYMTAGSKPPDDPSLPTAAQAIVDQLLSERQ